MDKLLYALSLSAIITSGACIASLPPTALEIKNLESQSDNLDRHLMEEISSASPKRLFQLKKQLKSNLKEASSNDEKLRINNSLQEIRKMIEAEALFLTTDIIKDHQSEPEKSSSQVTARQRAYSWPLTQHAAINLVDHNDEITASYKKIDLTAYFQEGFRNNQYIVQKQPSSQGKKQLLRKVLLGTGFTAVLTIGTITYWLTNKQPKTQQATH